MPLAEHALTQLQRVWPASVMSQLYSPRPAFFTGALFSRPLGTVLLSALCLAGCGGGGTPPASSRLSELMAGELLSSTVTERGAAPTALAESRLLRYRMPAVRGGFTQAQALLMLPQGTAPSTGWPLVVWAHGTVGVADACASSLDFWGPAGQGPHQPLIEALLAAGMAVLAPDYEGFGAPGLHPYYSRSSHAESVLSAVRAAHRVQDLRLSEGWAIAGHSQGGHVALVAAEFSPRMAARYPLRAAVAFAPGLDIAGTLDELRPRIAQLWQASQQEQDPHRKQDLTELAGGAAYSLAYNATMVAYGLEAQDPALKPELLLQPSFLPLASLAASENMGCPAFEIQLQQDLWTHLQKGGSPATYPALREDALAQPQLRDAFARSIAGQTRLEVPVLLLQGTADLQTPVGTARRQVERMRGLGSEIHYVELGEADHMTVMDGGRAQALAFIRERMR